MEGIVTQEAVDTSRVPGVTQAEFGKREFDKATRDDLASLEAEINSKLNSSVDTSTYDPVQPQATIPAPAPAPVQTPTVQQPFPEVPVPPKFQNPDGSLNQERLEKSAINLEAYLQKERELSALKAQNYQPQPNFQTPQPQPQYQAQYQPAPLEQQVSDGMRQDPGMTVLNLARAALLQSQAYADTQLREIRARQQLMEMGQNDPAVFTAEGLAKLTEIRKENPWLDAAPNPWFAAYKLSGGISPRVQAQAPVQPRPTAPIVPGGMPPAGIPASAPALTSERDLRRVLESKFPGDPARQFQAIEEIIARRQG